MMAMNSRVAQRWTIAFAVITTILGLVLHTTLAASSTNSLSSADLQTSIDISRQVRKTEISRALRLLKKHSIVGKNAKIVLKNSGKHLLIDGSDRLSLIPDSIDLSTNSNKNIPKLSKQQQSTTESVPVNSRNRKRSNSKETFTGPLTAAETANEKSTISKEVTLKRLMENAASRSATIIDSLMSDRMLNEVTRLVTTIVRNRQALSLTELADLISEGMDERFQPHWHTIVLGGSTNRKSNNTNNIDTNSISDTKSNSLTEMNSSPFASIGIDDHHKAATFYVTFDFGRSLRIFVFK